MLDIYLLYSAAPEPEESLRKAEAIAKKIEEAFKHKLFDTKDKVWNDIELRYIEPISDKVLSYAQARLLKKWDLNYISLADDPQQPIVE